jgi:threonine synthase
VKLLKRGEIRPQERVVVISTASGLKFTDFKVRYHENQIPGVQSEKANRPIQLTNDYETVKRAVLSAL